MRRHRLFVTGASGSGTTTLGRTLASLHAVPHADVDDYLWLPTSPPYTHKRPVEERLALMHAVFVPGDSWILSGSLRSWGDSVIEKVDGVVFLTLDPRTRMGRLMSRQVVRYGDTIERGGINEVTHHDFLDWARDYDNTPLAGGRREKDERWLARLSCPVLRLNSAEPVARLVAEVTDWLGSEVTAGDRRP
ncbi:hypothetical protein [Streptomyces sp. NPDC053048]|uniref:hypothetical protein n=1 Tax=Streptomyces sp. NPDC053048 TaxID=3365694 RepID=UPI0037D4AF62